MPVLINKSTGLAEDLPIDQVNQAYHAGTHFYPLNDPSGHPVNADPNEAANLLSQGYTQPNQQQLSTLLTSAKQSSTGEQLKALGRGAAIGVLGGFAPKIEQKVLGTSPQEQLENRTFHPELTTLGQGAGLTGSSMVGVGEGAILNTLGEAGTKLLGLGEATNLATRVGSSAVRAGIETALMQGDDELAKKFVNDPDQTAGSAAVRIGLMGLMGGVTGAPFGAIPDIWKYAQESNMGKMLNSIREKANGESKLLPGMPEIPEGAPGEYIDKLIDSSGISVSPEIKAALSSDPVGRDLFRTLQESATSSGAKAQEAFKEFKKQSSDAILGAFGKSPEEVEALHGMSDFDTGNQLKNSIINEVKQVTDPLSKEFEAVKSRFADTPLSKLEKNMIADNIGKFAKEEGIGLVPGSDSENIINKAMKGLANPELKNLEDFRKFQSQLLQEAQSKELWNVSKGLRGILRDSENTIVEQKLSQEAPQLIPQHQAARSAYSSTMGTIDDLNDRLHVGSYGGPASFLTKLGEMAPEDILRRLTPKNDAGLLSLVSEKFPQTSELLKNSYQNQILKSASMRAPEGQTLNTKTLFGSLDKWSPELKNFAINSQAQERVGAVRQLLQSVPDRMNNSGTAKTLDRLWGQVPGGAMAMVSMIMGHNPAMGYILGQLGKMASREFPDAVKLSVLKFLGSDKPIDAQAFKTTVDYVAAAIKGEKLLGQAVKSVFEPGVYVFNKKDLPDEKDRNILKDKIDELHLDPKPLFDVAGKMGHYIPEHAMALASIPARALNYLYSLKPDTSRAGPLDPLREPSKVEEAHYNEAINVAMKPISVLHKIKEGNLTSQDVETVKVVYPSLYDNMHQKITNEMIDAVSNEKTIPYKVRTNLSLFMGQSLDSTMTPQAIQAAQVGNGLTAQRQMQKKMATESSQKAMSKVSGMYQTRMQSREEQRTQNK